MKLTVKGEFAAGKENGLLHNNDHWLDRENLVKIGKGMLSTYPLIRAYWTGYKAGYYSRFASVLSNSPKERVQAKRELRKHFIALKPDMNYRKLCNLVRPLFDNVEDENELMSRIQELELMLKADS